MHRSHFTMRDRRGSFLGVHWRSLVSNFGDFGDFDANKIITSLLGARRRLGSPIDRSSDPQTPGDDSMDFCEHLHPKCSRSAASDWRCIPHRLLNTGSFFCLVIILNFTLLPYF